MDIDKVFKALADPTRRRLLDALRACDGQTLGALCSNLAMTRQAVTQHLARLADANLVATVRRGREKLHYLNPVPIHEIADRWIAPYREPHLNALRVLKNRLEGRRQVDKPEFVYVTYIATTPEKVWQALTDPAVTAEYWQYVNLSDFKAGSSWEHRKPGSTGSPLMVGKVLESSPPKRLVLSWVEPEDERDKEKHTRVTFELVPTGTVVRLTVTHDRFEGNPEMLGSIKEGWPKVLSSLKTLLESGRPLPSLW